MITLTTLIAEIKGLDSTTVEAWIAQDWVRPRHQAGAPVFEAVDIARVRLILELRDELDVGETAMPVVLSLLDQLHASQAGLRRLLDALEQGGDRPARDVLAVLRGTRP